jgi:aminoglycoside 2''-phosphotransferase
MDLQRLGDALAARVHDAGEIRPLRWLDAGYSSVVVESPGGVVWRIGRHAAADEAYRRERVLLPALAPWLPVAVPDPRWYVEPGEALPFGAIGSPRLQGEPVDPARFSGDQVRSFAVDVARMMLALHAFPVERAVALGVLARADARPTWYALRDATMPAMRLALSPAECARLAAFWDEVAGSDLWRVERPALVHGDLWYGNLLIDRSSGRLNAVLDFEEAAISDLARDFATLLHVGPEFTRAALNTYRAGGGSTGARLADRVRRHWELRELGGVRLALALGDSAELEEAIAKVRAGAIFRPMDLSWLGE